MTKRICIIEDCERKHYARGWCSFHYQREYLAGNVESRPRVLVRHGASMDTRLRHIGWTVTESGCWEFNGSRNLSGYGQMAVGNHVAGRSTPKLAPRVAYETWVGPIPGGEFVCHKCDNPPCINPAHLFAGTRQVNIQDMVDKGRNQNGEQHTGHKLSDADVATLRSRYSLGGVTQRALAEEYGVCQQLISMLTRGERRLTPTRWATP